MCPTKTITLAKQAKTQTYVPEINKAKCKTCGLCLKVCPGYSVDFKLLNKEFLKKESPSTQEETLLGNYINCYTGFSTDANVRFDSSSGGMVTQLLIFALETGLIDGALVTRMKKTNPLEPEPFIARTKQEILEASKSKYCPVPANVTLREIIENNGRYAVVGLPCHLHGVRKAELVNRQLRERIVLHLGLVCTHNDNFLQIDYLLRKYGIRSSDVAGIDFRGKGWPGTLTLRLKSGGEVNYRFNDWVGIHEQCFFTPYRCLVCCDQLAELSDLSFGDAWLPEFLNDHFGTSIVISRTQNGEDLLSAAKKENKVSLNSINGFKVAKSQGMMRFKKNGLGVRIKMFKLLGKEFPLYHAKIVKSGFIDYPRSCIIFVNQYLSSRRNLWWSLKPIVDLQFKAKKIYVKLLNHVT